MSLNKQQIADIFQKPLLIFIVALVFILINMIDVGPSNATVTDVKVMQNNFSKYENDVEALMFLKEKIIIEVPSSKGKFSKELTLIQKNLEIKKKLKTELVKSVLEDKEWFKDEDSAKKIIEYYKIDDRKLIKKINEYYNLVHSLYSKEFSMTQFNSNIYEASIMSFNKLLTFYKKQKTNTKTNEKITLINTMNTNILEKNEKVLEYYKDNYTKTANEIIEMQKIAKDFKELDSKESLVLNDMDIKFFIQIGRSSWDSYSDYGEKNYLFPMQAVSRKQYEAALSNINNFANRLSNSRQNEPRGHNSRSFWINDKKEVYYHKYLRITQDKKDVTPWIKVELEYFHKNKDNIKKVIFLKEYGDFISEATVPLTEYKEINSSSSNSNQRYSSGGMGFLFWGNTYSRYHRPYYAQDSRRYSQNKQRSSNIRGTSSRNTSRGPSGGGK